MWNDDITKANIYRHIISYGIHMGSKIESCTRIFLFDCDRFYFDTSCVKRYPIFMAYNTQDFLEDTSQEIPVTTDPVCHKIHINRRTSLKSIHGIKQRAAFQQEFVLVLAYRNPVKQSLVEVPCQKIHVFIACLIHEVEQACLYRLAIVFLSHYLILLRFRDNFSTC